MLKAVAWSIGVLVVALAVVFGLNATDEELTDLARKAMIVPTVPASLPDNGYSDLLALQSITADLRFQGPCGARPYQCLKHAAERPDLVQLSRTDDEATRRYRVMRARPQFVDLYVPTGPDDPLLSYRHLTLGQARALLLAADLANHGRLDGAVAELEAENAFHRRIAAGSRNLITKLIAFVLLHRDAFFASEIARLPGPEAKAQLARLKAIMRPLTPAEVDIRPALEVARAESATWMQTRRYARVPEDDSKPRPWWDPLAPYLYRPHQSVNLYVAQTEVLLRVAAASSREFTTAADAARREANALAPATIASVFVNPVGRDHALLVMAKEDGVTPYLARAHVTQALYTLVSLQIGLRAAGATSVEAVGQALASASYAEYADPFTGKPMRLDPATKTIGFDLIVLQGGTLSFLQQHYGRAAVELALD